MQFIDLNKQYALIEDELRSAFDAIFSHKRFIMGPEIEQLESDLQKYTGVSNVISCSSGTDALVMPLLAYALSKTDAVFVPSFTFFASAESITLAGGTPVFVDCNEDTYNMSLESLENAIARTIKKGELTPRGIIPVDLFGLPADYDGIRKIADEYGLFILADSAQGLGGTYKGKKTGQFGNACATSFFPAKPLGCYGDGGAIFTDDDDLAEVLRSLRVHGQGVDKYDNVRIGLNGRMDSFQAAVLISKLKIFDAELEKRNKIARMYTDNLKGVIKTPVVPDGYTSTWAQYTLTAASGGQRDKIMEALKQKDIPTAVYYRIPIHLCSAYAHLGYQQGSLPVCEDLSKKVFSVPMNPYLTEQEVLSVCEAIKGAIK